MFSRMRNLHNNMNTNNILQTAILT